MSNIFIENCIPSVRKDKLGVSMLKKTRTLNAQETCSRSTSIGFQSKNKKDLVSARASVNQGTLICIDCAWSSDVRDRFLHLQRDSFLENSTEAQSGVTKGTAFWKSSFVLKASKIYHTRAETLRPKAGTHRSLGAHISKVKSVTLGSRRDWGEGCKAPGDFLFGALLKYLVGNILCFFLGS